MFGKDSIKLGRMNASSVYGALEPDSHIITKVGKEDARSLLMMGMHRKTNLEYLEGTYNLT